MSKTRLSLLAATGFVLAGCGLPPALMVASYVAEGILVASSGKTIGGHALSTVTQQDCAMWRALQGNQICQDPTIQDNAEILLASGVAPATEETSLALAQPITHEDSAAIRLAQVYLNNFGYSAGPIDGVAGPQTLAAMQAYGADMGRQNTSTLTYDDLDFLSGQFGDATEDSPSLVDDRTTTILLAQAYLSYYGYQPGPLDGIGGTTTNLAIAHFQTDKGMAPDGNASTALLTVLRDELPDRSNSTIAATPRPNPKRRTDNAG